MDAKTIRNGLAGFVLAVAALNPGTGRADTGLLPPCPDSPNCVSSLSDDPKHRVEPLRYTDSFEQAWQRLERVLDDMPRTRVVERTPQRLHVEFTSLVLRFVDDLVCVPGAEAGVIHIRSASRVGYSDFGVNRRRVEAVRARFEQGREKP